MGNGLKDS